MREIVLINITGKDKPGLTSSLTNILAQYEVNILDIGQAVIHDYLSLGMLVEIPSKHSSSSILKDLLFQAHKLDIQIRFSAIDAESYIGWVAGNGHERLIITLLGRILTAEQLSEVTAAIADNQLNIDIITKLSGWVSPDNPELFPKACIQLTISGKLNDPGRLRRKLLEISKKTGIDISFHVDDIYRHARRLIVFDMDSTLIQCEVINELAKHAGVGEQVARITESAMNGEMNFKESFTQRVALLKGLDERILAEVAGNLDLTEGAQHVVTTLKKLGFKIGIISGGFDYFGKYLQNKLGLDYVFTNVLEIKDGKITGNVTGDIIDGHRKAEILKTIATVENISLQQTIAVGDGANDLPMISIAGLGIAFHAKPTVKENAKESISSVGLDGLLYLMGISEKESSHVL
ncbi:MAG: phosphoserine phosphatase SerB [Proteobacteria bacterium]|nr:phosphoserine phosphatase SerB [Pseudomonadota bacterium]MBU1697364.1 phosphoserine phosphatase SerB [Pseudomonadota bacterium]